MNPLKTWSVFFLAGALSFGGCSKTGPVGPQGPQGEQGPAGEQGARGIPGADGSVIYSDNGAPAAGLGKEGDYYIDKSAGNIYGPKTGNDWGNPLSLKGPKGAQGDRGATGDQGPQGDPGQDGSRIWSGTSAPAVSVGALGDYYWNTSNRSLYGPKTGAGWGNGIMLRGPKGDKGDPGTANVIYSGWMDFFNNGGGNNLLGRRFLSMRVLDNNITADIEDHGVVIAYCKLGVLHTVETYHTTPVTISLPTDLRFDLDDDESCHLDFTYNAGHIYFMLSIPSSMTDYLSFPVRYVIIPGGVHTRKASPPPDPGDYKATCAYYGIPE